MRARVGASALARAALVLGLALAVVTLVSCGQPSSARPAASQPRKRAEPPRPPRPHATAAATSQVEHGLAVWYRTGTMTASGERFDRRAMTAAHRTLPFGTRVRVTAVRSGKSVVVRINDRGPFGNAKRIIDLSEAAAEKIDLVRAGVTAVTVEILEGP